jgi:hypothetical protein
MNKAELIDAVAKDGNISKRAARTGRNPQTGKAIKNSIITQGLPTGKRTKKNGSENGAAASMHSNPYFVDSSLQGEMMLQSNNNNGSVEATNIRNQKSEARHNWIQTPSRSRITKQKQADDLILRKRPGRTQGDPVPGIGITEEQGYQDGDNLFVRKRPGRSQTIGDFATINKDKKLKTKPGRTKNYYVSSRSNKNSNH